MTCDLFTWIIKWHFLTCMGYMMLNDSIQAQTVEDAGMPLTQPTSMIRLIITEKWQHYDLY